MIFKSKSLPLSIKNVQLKDLEIGDKISLEYGYGYKIGTVIGIKFNEVYVKHIYGIISKLNERDWFLLRKKRKSLFDLIFKK